MLASRAVSPSGWMGSVVLSTVPAGFARSRVDVGRGLVVRARRVGSCAAVAGVVPVIDARGWACWDGTLCCHGVVTTSLVNATTSGVGRSSKCPVCAGPAWGNTGGRVAIGVRRCCRGTSRERWLVGSRAVSYSPRELSNHLISSIDNSCVTPFDELGRAFRGSTGTER